MSKRKQEPRKKLYLIEPKQKPKEQLYLIEWEDGSTDIMLLPAGLNVEDRVWLKWARAYVTLKFVVHSN